MPLAILQATPDLTLIGAERMRRSLALFCQRAWGQIDTQPLVWNWHLDLICACLEAVTRNELNDLLINIPPGHAKSMIVSVLWPAWEWAVDPQKKLISSSYIDSLVARDAVRFRDLIFTPWYQEHFVKPRTAIAAHEATKPEADRDPIRMLGAWGFKDDQNLKMHMKNTLGGERIGVTTGSGTGHRAHTEIVDDPLSAETATSKVEREAVVRWFFETMSSRFVDQDNGKRVIIMQRLHEADLAGEVITRGGFAQLVLPTEFDPKRRAEVYAKPHKHSAKCQGEGRPECLISTTERGRLIAIDPRTVAGELLFPARFPKSAIDQAKSPKGMGAQAYHAQHQQVPTPPEGNLIKRAWFTKRWLLPGEAPLAGYVTRPLPRPSVIEIVTDAAFKKTDTSDFVACGVWGLLWPDIYLLDIVWARMTFTETLQAIRGLKTKWKRASGIVIEDKANGSALIDTLKQELSGVIGVEPEGGKESRIAAAARYIEAGNVWLPQSALDQTGALIEEAVSFPKASHDDGIDMTAYAINRFLTDADAGFLEEMMRGVK